MRIAPLACALALFTLGASLQTAQAASPLIGKRVQNTYDVTLYLDPEKALAYALKDWKFRRYHYNPRKPKITYAMDSVAANPTSTAQEPVVVRMATLSERKIKEKNYSEEEQCYQAFTEVLGSLVYYAAAAKQMRDDQYFHLADVITLLDEKTPGEPGVVTCTIPDHGSIAMYARGQVSLQ